VRDATAEELDRAFAAIVDQDSGEVRVDGRGFVLVQRETMAELQRGLEEILGRGAESVLVRVGYKRGTELSERLVALVGDNADAFVEGLRVYAGRTGLCRVEGVAVDPPKVVIRASNSFIAMGYGSSGRPVCHYLRGVLLAAGERLLHRKELECVETTCFAAGDPECGFEVTPLPGSGATSSPGV